MVSDFPIVNGADSAEDEASVYLSKCNFGRRHLRRFLDGLIVRAGTHSPLINQFASDAKSELFAFFSLGAF